jgi:chitinase
VNRDRECNPPDNGYTSSECSSVTQNSWDFTAYTVAFAKNAPVTQPSPSPTPTPTGGGGSCTAAPWVSNQAYTSGNVVSYNGNQWTANQWNYDEVPGGPSGAWNNDGPC